MKKTLVGKKVVLRKIVEKDLPLFFKWLNDPEVNQFIRAPVPKNLAQERKWFKQLKADERNGLTLHYCIVDKRKKKLIGGCGLKEINKVDENAELAILIGDKNYWGKGFGTESMKLVIEYGFAKLGLHSIFLTVVEFNKRAIKAYEKIGFRKEGVLREHAKRNGVYYNTMVMSLLEREWKK